MSALTPPSDPSLKRKPTSPPATTSNGSPSTSLVNDGFTKILTKEEKRKKKKTDKQRPSFQFDLSHFRMGKKIGIAVSTVDREDDVVC
jgi:RNA exonuclease 1